MYVQSFSFCYFLADWSGWYTCITRVPVTDCNESQHSFRRVYRVLCKREGAVVTGGGPGHGGARSGDNAPGFLCKLHVGGQ